MRILVVCCHPVETSYHASPHAEALEGFLARVGRAFGVGDEGLSSRSAALP
ncbi:hypothetical protein [Xylophilus ampelinus]|uniref:Flavodoxin-like protein n=1 Tax=Xylophilus ampelinus TaxID=54067 RepID=A0A318SW39_9BURK|nr:hypothetical protein [Xylophilus ampelinus]MCS4511182.1 hypothetical protein [Xylophilus ampelinus]PYE75064.1 hypothetical protein DFQ15_12017 [Xylophilus ampelinus]